MPQSTAAIRQKADTLRILRNPEARVAVQATKGTTLNRPVRARNALACQHGHCLALDLRGSALWVLVRDLSGKEAWAPIERILHNAQRRDWARTGF